LEHTADVNRLTAPHGTYKKGDRACVEILLEKGVSETVLNALGRAPSHLMPEGSNSLNDHDIDMASGDQPDLEQQLDALSPFQHTTIGTEHRVQTRRSLNNTDRTCPAQFGPMDVCYPVASTSKAAFGGPMSQAQYTGGQRCQNNPRIPDVPNDHDINSFIPKLWERFADTEAIEYLRKVSGFCISPYL